MQNHISEDTERFTERTSLFIELSIAGATAIASIFISYLFNHNNFFDSIPSTLLLSLTSYSSVSLLRILLQHIIFTKRLKHLSSAIDEQMLSRDVTQTLSRVLLQLSTHEDRYMRIPALSSFKYFLDNTHVSDDAIELKSSFIAIEAYNQFWRTLTAVQTRNPTSNTLSVYVTHSSPIRLWDSTSSQNMLGVQRGFIDAGGHIYRILIRNDNIEKYDDYERVINRMISDGVEAYFLDTVNTGRILRSEFAVVYLDDKWYALVWSIRQYRYGVGTIDGCHIYRGLNAQRCFEEWQSVVSNLVDYSPSEIPDTFTGIKRRPSSHMINTMRRLPIDSNI